VKASDYDSDALMRRGDFEGRRRRRIVGVPSFHGQPAGTTSDQIDDRSKTPTEHRDPTEALVNCVMEDTLPRIVYE